MTRTASVPEARSCNAASESRTCDIAGYALSAARTIPLTRACGKIERSRAGDWKLRICLAVPGDTIGVAESAGLNFFNRRINGHGCGASELSRMYDHGWTRAATLQDSGHELSDVNPG